MIGRANPHVMRKIEQAKANMHHSLTRPDTRKNLRVAMKWARQFSRWTTWRKVFPDGFRSF